MATALARVTIYSSSFGLPDTVANIARRVEKRGGYKGVAESVGSGFGIIPNWGPVTFRAYGVTENDVERFRADVKAEIGGNFVNSWKNLVVEFTNDVVVQSVADTGTLVKETAVAVKNAAGGIGIGLGLGLVLLGAAYLLVLRGGKA